MINICLQGQCLETHTSQRTLWTDTEAKERSVPTGSKAVQFCRHYADRGQPQRFQMDTMIPAAGVTPSMRTPRETPMTCRNQSYFTSTRYFDHVLLIIDIF